MESTVCVHTQADFVVPSSREAVNGNDSWNEELRAYLPALFVKAQQSFKNHHSTEDVTFLNAWFQCIPLPGEVRVCTVMLHCMCYASTLAAHETLQRDPTAALEA